MANISQSSAKPIRLGIKMEVFPEMIEDYIKIHNPIWTALKAVFRKHGVISYSIFLDRQTNSLFAYVLVSNIQDWKAIAATKVCQDWWKEMKRLMPTGSDSSPISFALEEVFHFESSNDEAKPLNALQ